MDMKLYRQHLKTHLKESKASTRAERLIQRLDEYEKASRALLTAWIDLQEEIGYNNDVEFPKGYPYKESFDEVVERLPAFVKSFKETLRKIR